MKYHIECSDKNYDLILKEYKEIPLTQGKVALVDIEDYDYLNQFKWRVCQSHSNLYALRHIKINKKQTTMKMHREIMKPLKNIEIDHKNKDGLDNRKDNLRTCTSAQNKMNRGRTSINISGYKGVHWHKENKKWRARIGINKKCINLGCYNEKKKAALAYNEAAKKYHGEFARLNIFGKEN